MYSSLGLNELTTLSNSNFDIDLQTHAPFADGARYLENIYLNSEIKFVMGSPDDNTSLDIVAWQVVAYMQ